MLAKRIVPCLDIKDGRVVKGVKFRNHEIVGEIAPLASRYSREGADELVLYDIAASARKETVAPDWVEAAAREIDIPFSVAGGIRTVEDARARLFAGADKISINSPAIADPSLIDRLAAEFGSQCVVLGVDSRTVEGEWRIHQFTGDPDKTLVNSRRTLDWIAEAVDRGAGEVVLNCMDQDGVREGYDVEQLAAAREICSVPLIASGGAGAPEHFKTVFEDAGVDAALAASIFHKGVVAISDLKAYLDGEGVEIRL